MKNKILYFGCLAFLFLVKPTEVKAQCHIKDVIMGTVPEDKNPDDERYFWTRPVEKPAKTAFKRDTVEYAPHTLIILYENKKSKKGILKAIRKKRCSILYDYKIINGIAIKTPEAWNINDALHHFEKVEGVIAVNRDRINHIH